MLPGSATIGGLWPAIWLLGNLGRNTYEQSTNKIWPWSFDKCDFEKQAAQEISACDKTSHFGMAAGKGRGGERTKKYEYAFYFFISTLLPHNNKPPNHFRWHS